MGARRLTIYLVLGSLQARATRELLQSSATDAFVINASTSHIPACAGVTVRPLQINAGLGSALDYWRLSLQLQALQRAYGSITIAVPHLYHLVANHLYFHVCDDEVVLLPDGTLTLTPMKVRQEQRRKMRLRSTLAPLVGFRYCSFDGSLHGFDGRVVDRVVTYFDSPYLPAHKTLQRLSLKGTLPIANGTCLIVDQPLERAVDSRSDINDIGKQVAEIASKFAQVYVKLHPRQTEPLIAREIRNAVMLDKSAAVEDLFIDSAPEVIIGTSSTALITMKHLFPEIGLRAIGLNRVESARPEFGEFRTKLISIGGECVDV